MEVSPGYTQNSAGPFPVDWKIRPLSESLVDRPRYGINAAAVPFSDRLPTYIRITDISPEGHFAAAEQVSVDAVGAGDYFLSEGDIVFARTGASVGKSYRYRSEDGPLVFAGFLIRVRTNPNCLLPGFLAAYVTTGPYWSWVRLMSMRSGQPGINGTEYAQLPVPHPPLPEQRAIAAALSDVDALLSGLERLIAKKHDLKQAAIQQLLTGQIRLPSFGNTGSFESDDIGMRPSDWDVTRLKDLVDPSRGIRYGIVQPGAYDRNGRFMIRGQDYSEAKGWADPSEVFRVSDAVEQRYRSARVQHGDLIMTIVGYCGHIELVPAWLDGANLTQTTARIAIQPDKASPSFCKYILQSAVGKRQVTSFLKGAAQPGLNCGDVENFRLPLPPLREQTAIATVLSDMDAELTAIEARRNKTRDLKQAMMQELLTGKTRLVLTGGVDA
ncbi:MAG: restriction endonuclease subunit S [Thermoleophilia bacterium]|nr:restriction endonuclease subunit S [Thermoleophilia bacterium]